MNVGTLTLEIATNVARIQADMDKTKKLVSGAMGDVTAVVNQAKSAFIALTGVAGVGAFAHMINGAIESKAHLYDLYLQTGINVEALGGLAKVGLLSGASLDDIASASNKLNKALATNTEDSKGAAQAVKVLGLSYNEFRQMKADEQMLAVAKAMDRFEDGTGKSAAAMLLFGKTGATLLPFLKELAERGILATKETTEASKAAKEYQDNLVLLKGAGEGLGHQIASELLPALLAVTKELLDIKAAGGDVSVVASGVRVTFETLAVMGANVAFVFRGMGREIGAIAAQGAALARGDFQGFRAISDAVKADGERARAELDAFEKRVMGAKEAMAKEAPGAPPARPKLPDFGGVGSGGKTTDTFTPLLRQIADKVAAEKAEYDSVLKLTDAQKLQAKVFSDLDGGYLKLTLNQKLVVDGRLQELLALEKLNLAEQANAKWLEQSRQETQQALEMQDQRLQQYDAELIAAKRQLEEYGLTASQLDRLDSARLRDAAAVLLQRRGIEDFNPAQAQMNRLLEEQAQRLGDVADIRDQIATRQAHDRNDPYAGASRAVKQYLEEVKQAGIGTEYAVRGAIGGLEDGLTQLFTKGRFDARSFVDQLIAEFFRLSVVKPLLGDIFSGFGGGGGGGGFGGLLSLGATLFGGPAAGVAAGSLGADYSLAGLGARFGGGLAHGGPAQSGTPYLVGEKGPELFVPRSAGTVVPNGALGQAVAVTYAPTINIDSRSDRAQVAQQTAAAVQAGNRQLLEMLHARGVV